MSKKLFTILSMLLIVSVILTACGGGASEPVEAPSGGEEEPAGGEEEPASDEPITITWATIAGFYTDHAESIAAQFEEETGITVEVVDIDFPQLYEKQVLEMVSGTGAYDIITYDGGWKAEFAHNGYLLPLDDFITASDPEEIQFENIAPALVELTTRWRGQVMGLPYYTFTAGMHYRCDLFENADEAAAFEAAYGYPLAPPQTFEQMGDIAEFFRREPGDNLAGQTLEDDFYGIGLMAGRFPHIQDEIMSIVWTNGGNLIKDDGTVDVESLTEATEFYVEELLPYAPPGALTSAFDEVMGQMRQGVIAMTGPFYLDQWPNAVKTEAEVPGAKMCTAASPGAHTWVGAFGLAVSKDSKNPQAAFDFIKFLTGPEASKKFALGGGSITRIDLLSDRAFAEENRAVAGHFPTLADTLEHTASCPYYANYFYVPQGGKIYDEETTWFSSAAAGESTPAEAMENLAEAIERICDGPCEILNDHLGEGYSPQPCPYEFDMDLQVR